MKRDTAIQLAALLVLLVALVAAGLMMPRLSAAASEAQLYYTDATTERAATASIADEAVLDVARSVGVLRGVAVNYLWIRADRLKEDGKFFEAYQIARWITQLQPRFARVWQFQAWNMAYNISVATHTREERWSWVQNGVRLLRERGIRYNPNDMMLYKELAWHFMHKIGGFTDDAHKYYKQQMARQWQSILGEPPYEYEQRMDRIREIVEAPDTMTQLIALRPNTLQLVADLAQAGFKPDEDLLRQLETLNAVQTSYMGQKLGLDDRLNLSAEIEQIENANIRAIVQQLSRLKPVRENAAYADTWPLLIAHIRKTVLLQNYNMEPEFMLKYMEQYGPLDWRSPFSHSIYWAALGVERALTRINQDEFDQINTDRLLFHSTQNQKFNGRIYFDYLTSEISWGPDLRFIPYYADAFQLILDRMPPTYERATTFIDGYRNFLIDSVREYYQWGEYEKAEEMYARLRTDPRMQQQYQEDRFLYPIQEFILRETVDRWETDRVARGDVQGMLSKAFTRGLARGDRDTFNAQYNNAKAVYDYFMSTVGRTPTAVMGGEYRMGMPAWDQMLATAFQAAMTDESTSWAERMALWENSTPLIETLKVRTYDLIAGPMQAAFERQFQNTMPFELAFPEPAGLEAWRAQRALEQEQESGMGDGDLRIERK